MNSPAHVPTNLRPAHPAIENLRTCQRQLDMDGCEVGVSRQALEETLAELDRLTADLATHAALLESLQNRFAQATQQVVDAEAQLAACKADAERYRWLRDHWWLDDKADDTPAPMMCAETPEQFDATIDAARAALTGGPKP